MESCSLGWCPDVPDLRDLVLRIEYRVELPVCVDLREQELDFSEAVTDEPMLLHTTCAVSTLAMLDWQSRKWEGRGLDGSSEFLHQLTVKIWGGGGPAGVGLRSTLKTLTRFGAPPTRLCLAHSALLINCPELFGFRYPFGGLQFVRLDSWEQSPRDSLDTMRFWLAQGNPFLIGFAVPHNISPSSMVIPFDVYRGGTQGGTACVVMGYDDDYPVQPKSRSVGGSGSYFDSGALLIKTFWGKEWYSQGFAWLPYAFVENQFARDAWAVKNAAIS